MRSIWNGAIGFGLVNIPVKLYSATEDSKLDLDMLDSADGSRIRFKRVNETTDEEVAWENIVKAYKLNDEYVRVEEADFEAVSPEKSKIISIQQFVKMEEVDAAYFETPYFLEPQKNGEQAYNLLLQSLIKTKMCGIGTFILREKEIIGMIRPYEGNVLMLNRMRYSDELRKYDELKLESKKKPTKEELDMAIALIKQLEDSFKPEKFTNSYDDALLEIIKAKAKGKKPKVEKKEEKEVTTDLMAQLKASLQKSKKAS